MKQHWLPFRYRDFYDVPHAILAEYKDDLYFLDCPFDNELDDYEDAYTVYKVPEELQSAIDTVSWSDLGTRLICVGSVPVDAVEFDSTSADATLQGLFVFDPPSLELRQLLDENPFATG